MSDTQASPAAGPPTDPGAAPVLLHGTPVAPGLAIGVAHREDHDLGEAKLRRVPRDEIENELNRFQRSLTESRRQLEQLKLQLSSRLSERDAGILDTHLACLKDSVFLSDVENLILDEQMSLEGAIAKVIPCV